MIVGNIIPKSVKCIHSATKARKTTVCKLRAHLAKTLEPYKPQSAKTLTPQSLILTV